jgi:hypothetical protein
LTSSTELFFRSANLLHCVMPCLLKFKSNGCLNLFLKDGQFNSTAAKNFYI